MSQLELSGGPPTTFGKLNVDNGEEGHVVRLTFAMGEFPSQVTTTVVLDVRDAEAVLGMLGVAVESAKALLDELAEEVSTAPSASDRTGCK